MSIIALSKSSTTFSVIMLMPINENAVKTISREKQNIFRTIIL